MPDTKWYEYDGYVLIDPDGTVTVLEPNGEALSLYDQANANHLSNLKTAGSQIRRAKIKLYQMPMSEEATARSVFRYGGGK